MLLKAVNRASSILVELICSLFFCKDAEMSSEESDVELDMEGVLENPDNEESHEMGDMNKKEMTDDEMEKFDEARSSAMSTFSEVKLDPVCKARIAIHFMDDRRVVEKSHQSVAGYLDYRLI